MIVTDRKAAKQAERAKRMEASGKMRQAMVTGDDRYLPPRDKGPVRRFVREEIVPLEDKLDPDASELPPEDRDRLVAKVKAMGLYGLDIPAEFGGPGAPVSEYARRPAPQGLDSHGRPAPVAPQAGAEDHLDIPAFLRRQAN